MRVLPFHGYYILTGIGHVFPLESISIIKLFMRNKKKSAKKQNLNPLEICEIFFAQEEHERLPVQERFRLFCQEAGLENTYIDEIIRRLKQRAENPKENYKGDLVKDIMGKIKSYSSVKVEELIGAFTDLWNSLIFEGKSAVRIGPIETAIIHAGINYVQSKVNPDKYKDVKKAEAKAEALNDQWLNTPKEELGGRTPVEVILEERRELGNPQKEVGFQVSLTKLEMNPEIEQQAEKLFYQGIEFVRQHKPTEALKVYEAYCQLNPDNHVVWQNMGVAHILLLDKVKAQECFQRALEINPDYEMPRRNLKMLKSATKEDIMRMAEEHKVQWFNKGKVV
jgi:tetratricopeptide (TPR) repeat protein